MNILSFFSDFWLIIVIFGTAAILYLVWEIIIPIVQYQKMYKHLQICTFDNDYKLSKRFLNKADFVLENNEEIVFVKMVMIPSNSSLTINNHFTFHLNYGGSSKKPGRRYPYSRYLTEVESFLKWQPSQEKQFRKVVVLDPSTEKIQKYLNESEIALVQEGEKVYDYQVVSKYNFKEKILDE
ncbi:MAG: hypothetical protein AB7V00_06605 [Bacilli bacterium]